jgi:hypothetical protein
LNLPRTLIYLNQNCPHRTVFTGPARIAQQILLAPALNLHLKCPLTNFRRRAAFPATNHILPSLSTKLEIHRQFHQPFQPQSVTHNQPKPQRSFR